jgi:serine phosphatase RsbU (regulator of sigma subunit)
MLRTADALLRDQQPDSWEGFCSACCAVIQPGPVTRVAIASAGHPQPWLLRADGRATVVPTEGSLLGVGLELQTKVHRLVLKPGDHLVLYTDGLTEARDAGGAFFGEVRGTGVFTAMGKRDADRVVQRLLDAVEQFTDGHLRDDLALLVIGVPT